MHTKPFRVLLFFILVIACLGFAYLTGYGRGHRAAVYDQTTFGVLNYLSLYKLSQQGDTNRLNAKLRFMIFGYSDYFDKHFSSDRDTNQFFSNSLLEARAIANQERPHVVNVDSALRQINEALQAHGRSNTVLKPTATTPLVSTNR